MSGGSQTLALALAVALAHFGGASQVARAQSAFHTAPITRVAADAASRVLVTASEDKTVRVWELQTGKLLRTIEAPSRPGQHGKVLGLAISPDGSRIAFSGYTGQKNRQVVEKRTHFDYEIYVHDLRSGRRLHTLTVPGVVDNLGWSPAGDVLLATMSELPVNVFDEVEFPKKALHFYKAPQYTRLQGPENTAIAAVTAFGRGEQVVVVGKQGGGYDITTYDRSFTRLESRSLPIGVPGTVSFSPDGSMFAVGSLYSQLTVHSTADLSVLFQQSLGSRTSVDTPAYTPIAWSADGRWLYVAAASLCGGDGCVRKWATADWRSYIDIPASPYRITHLTALGTGDLAFGTVGPSFGILDATDKRVLHREALAISPKLGSAPQDDAAALNLAVLPDSAVPSADTGEFWSECVRTSMQSFGQVERVRGRHLYINKSGAAVLAPRVDFADDFSGGLASIRLGEKHGYIDRAGRMVIPPKFGRAYPFAEGRAIVQASETQRYQFIETTGKPITPAKYVQVAPFSEGLAAVKEEGSSGFGYIDTSGRTVIPLAFADASSFSEGLAAVRLGDKWGYINKRGEWAIKPSFEGAWDFSEGLAAVLFAPCGGSSACMYSVIDVSGSVMDRASFEGRPSSLRFSDGMAVVRLSSRQQGFIDTKGQPVFDATFYQAVPFSEGLAAVSTADGRWGYVDKQGRFVVAPQFELAGSFHEGMAAVRRDGLSGYVDAKGTEVIPPTFFGASAFSEGVASVCVGADRFASIPFSSTPPASGDGPSSPGAVNGTQRATTPSLPAPSLPPTITSPSSPSVLRLFQLDDAEQRRLDLLHERVAALSAQRRHIEALPLAEEARTLVERRVPSDDPALIRPLGDLGRLRLALADYRMSAGGRAPSTDDLREGQRLLERALHLAENHKGPYHTEVAELANELSDLHALKRRWEFDVALDLKQRVLALAKGSGAADGPVALKAANDLEALRVEKLVLGEVDRPFRGHSPGDLAKALPMALEQVRRAERTLGAEHVNVARGLFNVAVAYGSSAVGVRRAALVLLERALALFARGDGSDPRREFRTRVTLARLYATVGDYSRAERTFAAVTEAAETLLGPRDEAVLQLLSERGQALKAAGQYDAAARLFVRVLSYWDERVAEASDRSHILGLRRALENLADTRHLQGDHKGAEVLYRRILASKDRGIVMNAVRVWPIQRKLGITQRLAGDLAAARETLESVLDGLAPELKPRAAGEWFLADAEAAWVLAELSALALSANDPKTAAAHLSRARALVSPRASFALVEERTLLEPWRTDSLYARLLSQTLEAAARQFRLNPELAKEAYEFTLEQKGAALDFQLRSSVAPDHASRQASRVVDELAAVRSQLAQAMLRYPDGTDIDQHAEIVTRLFDSALAVEAKAAGTGRWLETTPAPRITVADVAARVPLDGALIEFVRVRDANADRVGSEASTRDAVYFAFVLTPGGGLSLVELGPARAVDVLATDLQSALRGGGSARLTSSLLRQLYAIVWKPLEPLLNGIRQVLVSPDGELHRVPFAALVDQDDRFLIERIRFAHVSSGSALARATRKAAVPALDLALVADADFGDGGAYAPLPGTAVEAQTIPPLVRGSKGRQILRGRNATETALKALPPARVLHIATHGFFLDSTLGLDLDGYDQALVRSGLALAGANREEQSSSGDDGLLTALEVRGLNLSGTELVVLSSCDSGAGSVVEGEGVLGLRRAFSLAGAKNVLVTLWPVDDRVTSQVMVDFYRGLASVPPAAALHRAQLLAIGRLRQAGGPAPHLWAPFVLEGVTGF